MKRLIKMLCALLIALVWGGDAAAFSGGIATTSFPVPAQGCNFCHGGGSTPAATLECLDCAGGFPIVEPMSVHTFKLTVFEIGLQDNAGLNASSELGTLTTGGAFALGTTTITGTGGRAEITHTSPKPAAGGMTEFSFIWTAPAADTIATLVAWGNAVDGNGSTAGDGAARATLDVTVGVNVPTPTATPGGSTPTPTPTPGESCPAVVDLGCTTGFAKGSLLVKDGTPGRERLVVRMLQGPPLAQTDLGNPLDAMQGGTGTSYALCVYDDGSALAADLQIARAGDLCLGKPCWRPIGHAPNDPRGPGKGYRYRDRALASDGVLSIAYRGGDAGRSQVVVTGKGSSLPSGIPAALATTSQVTVQLRSSDGLCLSIDLDEIQAQDSSTFKAK
ncbi:MAG: choice-of-anchor V domain-containing protein [Candidatus Binatia bacterium]